MCLINTILLIVLILFVVAGDWEQWLKLYRKFVKNEVQIQLKEGE